MRRYAVLGLLISLATLACDDQRFEESSSEDFRFEIHEPTRIAVRVDDGSVDVERSTEGVVEVTFRKRARAGHRERARSVLESLRTEALQEGRTIRVRARSRLGSVFSHRNARVDIVLRVPEETELDIRTHDGRIELGDVSGKIDAETGDGRIQLSRVTGDIKLRTGDGSILASDVVGDLDVATGDGRIRLDGRFGALRAVSADGSIRVESLELEHTEGDWTIRSSDGSIELTLPSSISAEIDATTNDGRIVNELRRFEGTEREDRVKGTLGAGGRLIRVTTMDGRISLKEK